MARTPDQQKGAPSGGTPGGRSPSSGTVGGYGGPLPGQQAGEPAKTTGEELQNLPEQSPAQQPTAQHPKDASASGGSGQGYGSWRSVPPQDNPAETPFVEGDEVESRAGKEPGESQWEQVKRQREAAPKTTVPDKTGTSRATNQPSQSNATGGGGGEMGGADAGNPDDIGRGAD